MSIPDFVFKNGGTSQDWIPEHDAYKGNRTAKFNESVQETWWLTNWKIRNALSKISNSVVEELEKKRKVSIQEVSVTRIAKEAKLTRKTILHNNRIFWIEDFRSDLLKQIRKPIISEEQRQFDKIKRENIERKKNLFNQREETAKWLVKSKELEEEVRTLKRMLKDYEWKKTGNTGNNSRSLRAE